MGSKTTNWLVILNSFSFPITSFPKILHPFKSALFAFVIVLLSCEVSLANCTGISVPDNSEIESTLQFSRPAIEKKYSGYIGFFEVINEKKLLVKEFNEIDIRNRILEDSKEKCVPQIIVYPDIRMVIEEYNKGNIISKYEYEHSAKILKKGYLYHSTGKPRKEIPYKNDRIDGMVKYFHEDGTLNFELKYINDLQDGCFESHYKGGKKKSEGCFKKGKLNGQYKHFFDNGKLEIQSNYINGVLSGSYLENHKNGQTKTQGLYNNNVLDGNYQEWFKTGKQKVIAHYDNGLIIDNSYFYHEDDSIAEEYNVKQGHYKRYYKNASLKSNVSLVNGKYDGVYEEFLENGNLKAKGTYKNGLLEGHYKTFFGKKVLESESYFDKGKPISYSSYYEHGGKKNFTHFNKDGSVLRIDEYDLFGFLDKKIPYKNREIDGEVLKYYRDGSIAAIDKYVKGEKGNVRRGYYPDGSDQYVVILDSNGKMSNGGIYFPKKKKLNHFFEYKDGIITQEEYYLNGNIKLQSAVDNLGNEKRSFYRIGNNKEPYITQYFSSKGSLKSIFVDYLDSSLWPYPKKLIHP